MPVTASRRLIAAVAAALAVGLATFLAASLALFIGLQAATTNLGPITRYFMWPAIILVVLSFLVGLLDGYSAPVRRIIFSFVAAVLSGYFGGVIYFAAHGDSFSAALADGQNSLSNNNLVFAIFAIIAGVTIARAVHSWVLGSSAPTSAVVHGVALVRAPVKLLTKGIVTFAPRKVVSFPRAEKQWNEYVEALEAEGFEVIEVDRSDDHPDSVFIEDTVVMLGQTAVITSSAALTRRGEHDRVDEVVSDLGLATAHIRLPGTLDGGDVLKVGSTIYVGRGGRTNAEGLRQFRAIATELGYTVIGVPMTKALHLKSAVTALPDGTIIGHESLVDDPRIFDHYLEVPEPAGIAVLVLSPTAVMISASAPKTAELIESLGYRVVKVTISEFEKLEGCVTCLSVRIR